jgi:hypothetical protein
LLIAYRGELAQADSLRLQRMCWYSITSGVVVDSARAGDVSVFLVGVVPPPSACKINTQGEACLAPAPLLTFAAD